jgi:hypothetical protein
MPNILDQLTGPDAPPAETNGGNILDKLIATPEATAELPSTSTGFEGGSQELPQVPKSELDRGQEQQAVGTAGVLSAPLAALAPEGLAALKAAAESHPLVAAVLKRGLEGSALAAGAKWLHIFTSPKQ